MAAAHGAAAIRMADPATAVPIMAALIRADHGDKALKDRAAGLVVIGVHTPEYPWERSLPLMRQAVKDWRITYPVVADNEYAIWNAFGNQYWPAHYIFDARGQLRYTAFGEGDYARQEQVIQQLLQESKA